MQERQINFKSSNAKGWPINLQPVPAWTAILSLIMIILIGLLVRAAAIVFLVYYLGSVALGIFLYQRYPVLYIGFTWWLWFVGPFVKRLIDYQSNSIMPGAWHLIPALVTSISFITLVRHFPRNYKQGGLPFILGSGAVFYGALTELIQQDISLKNITVFLSWLAPVLFGFHLFVSWRNYPNYRRNIQSVFLWGALVMGTYGIWQFFMHPPWDIFWVMERCPCFQDRLWSTMTTPFTFGVFMSGSLILLLINQTSMKLPTTIFGYISFLLTLSRSAWLSWILSLLIMFPSLKAPFQRRLIITIMVISLSCLPLVSLEPFSEIIGSRIATFSNLESDDSYQGRVHNYQNNIKRAEKEL